MTAELYLSKGEPMHQIKAGKRHQRLRFWAANSKATAAIALSLTLLLAGATAANWGRPMSTTQGSKEKKSSEVTIESLAASAPSKEYIYAGGRLIATEECGYSISPADAFYSTAGAEGSVNLTASAGCGWTASSNQPAWLTLTSAGSGTGSDTISYIVRDNVTGSPRQGTLTIAGLTFTVTQEGLDPGECVYVISPTTISFNAIGGVSSVSVVTEERCAWQAVSNATWVTITSGCCGIDDGQVTYSVAQNTTGAGRAATITIADKTLTVKQKAT